MPELLFRNPCRCGCGLEARPGNEFRRGHVRRYIGELRKRANGGDQVALAELNTRGWSLADTREGKKFGVELEFFGVTHTDAVNILIDTGIDARDDGYHHTARPYWRVTEDGSVNGSGLELVSPILRLPTETSREAIIKGTRALREAGATIDRSCGHHVHHDGSRKDYMSVYQTVLHYCIFQHHIDSMLPRSRRSTTYNDYSRPLDLERVLTWPNLWLMRGEYGNEPWNLSPGKYRTLNLEHLTDYGTIEFRQHSGTLNGTKVWNWSRFTRLFMDINKDAMKLVRKYGTLEGFKRDYPFEDMLDYLGADDNLKSWAISRRDGFTSSTPDDEDVLSETHNEEPHDEYDPEPDEWEEDDHTDRCETNPPMEGTRCIYCNDYCNGVPLPPPVITPEWCCCHHTAGTADNICAGCPQHGRGY